jgi:hypothetical protein
MSKNLQQVLQPVRFHAGLSPDERLGTDRQKILKDLLTDLEEGWDRAAHAHVARTLDILSPRLYDLWDLAGEVKSPPAWLAPLAKYARKQL